VRLSWRFVHCGTCGLVLQIGASSCNMLLALSLCCSHNVMISHDCFQSSCKKACCIQCQTVSGCKKECSTQSS
jgi:hypothetical protein